MTATMIPASAGATEVHVFADLLPAEILDARRTRRLRRLIGVALVSLVVVVALGDGLARIQTSAAGNDLDQVRQQGTRLQGQLRAFTPLTTVQGRSAAITAELTTLMAGDVQWTPLLTSLRAVAPTGVTLTSVTGAVTARTPTAGAAGPGLAVLGGAGLQQVGTITLTGTATNPAMVAAYLDALRAVRGLAVPYPAGIGTEQGTLTFTATVLITTRAQGGRWTPRSTK